MTRACGPCTACCTIMGVEEIKKPAFEACPNCTSGGCGIYETRPESCRGYTCLWLGDPTGQFMRNMERPDRIGLILDLVPESSPFTQANGGRPVPIVREVWPGAWQTTAGQDLIGRLAKRTLVVLLTPKGRKLMGPEPYVRAAQRIMHTAVFEGASGKNSGLKFE